MKNLARQMSLQKDKTRSFALTSKQIKNDLWEIINNPDIRNNVIQTSEQLKSIQNSQLKQNQLNYKENAKISLFEKLSRFRNVDKQI